MVFMIEPAVFKHFPGMKVVAVTGQGLDNTAPIQAVSDLLDQAWHEAAEQIRQYPNVQSHPRVAAWGEAMRRVGVSRKKFPPSIEAMARRTLKSDRPFRINPLVDFYNAVSLKYLIPAGAYDLDQLESISLGLAREGDHFLAMDETAAEAVAPGEISYRDNQHILTRHFVWRQSRRGLIQPDTKHFLLVSEVLPGLGEAIPDKILADFLSGLKDYFDLSGQGRILSVDDNHLSLEGE